MTQSNNEPPAAQSERRAPRPSPSELQLLSRVERLQKKMRDMNHRYEELMAEFVHDWSETQPRELTGRWASGKERRRVVLFVERWAAFTGISRLRFIQWLGISESKYFAWKRQAQEEEFEASDRELAYEDAANSSDSSDCVKLAKLPCEKVNSAV